MQDTLAACICMHACMRMRGRSGVNHGVRCLQWEAQSSANPAADPPAHIRSKARPRSHPPKPPTAIGSTGCLLCTALSCMVRLRRLVDSGGSGTVAAVAAGSRVACRLQLDWCWLPLHRCVLIEQLQCSIALPSWCHPCTALHGPSSCTFPPAAAQQSIAARPNVQRGDRALGGRPRHCSLPWPRSAGLARRR